MTSLFILPAEQFPELLGFLVQQGFRLVGPTVQEGAIVYDEMASAEALPVGYGEEQRAGSYRLQRRDDERYFGYGPGPQSWKRFLHPPRVRLWAAHQSSDGFEIIEEREAQPRYAFIGVRACDLQAIAIQDRIWMGGAFVDPGYRARREQCFILAVNCGQAGGSCFCASMGSGPKAAAGFDLALTEVLEATRHYFVVEIGSLAGAALMAEMVYQEADAAEVAAAEQVVAETTRQMGRAMDSEGLPALLYRNYEHPEWERVAERCLSCGNCTMVCPTCFCTAVTDMTDLSGERAERWRSWDSCFTMDFSYLHGGSVRASTRSRYRQWMTHKLATWHEQFGSSGCVGCGRCITWCPVGIDITEELRLIRATDGAGRESDERA